MNLPSYIVLGVIVAVVTAVIILGIRNRRQGKSSCGGGCAGCAMRDHCHSKKK